MGRTPLHIQEISYEENPEALDFYYYTDGGNEIYNLLHVIHNTDMRMKNVMKETGIKKYDYGGIPYAQILLDELKLAGFEYHDWQQIPVFDLRKEYS
ncbi:MAG: hypothetical protein QMD85_03950 [Candidatus Aenigmarchaeota archaeon]|nr:hypothetical protein [Candidatus Aenigmarchaeota archaeon]MDI6722710.1 hypothetical protein [Candidatus Aenigmarchaeota archaeon]